MHGWISPNLVHRFGNDLLEGQTYEIQNFIVSTYTERYKCFASGTHIYFTQITTLKVVLPSQIDTFGEIFDFTYLGNINPSLFQDIHCIGKPSTLLYIFYHI